MFEHSDFEYMPLSRFDTSSSAKRGTGKETQFAYILEDTVGLLYNKQTKKTKKNAFGIKIGKRIKNFFGKKYILATGNIVPQKNVFTTIM